MDTVRRGNGRRFVLAALVAVLFGALVVAGCGDDDNAATGGGSDTSAAKEPSELKLQLSWFVDETVTGEVVALKKGFYDEAGLDVKITPGGPTNDGVAPVAAGKADVGIASDSPSIMLAASQGIPIKAFGSQLQRHPYAYVSRADTPLSSPSDLAGKTVGIPPTGTTLLEALLSVNGMSKDDLKGVEPISFEITPLVQKKIDVWGGWETDTAQLAKLDPGYHVLNAYDNGVKLYAGLYFANPKFLAERADDAEAFLTATAKGWQFARDNPEEAAEILTDAYPNIEGGSKVSDIVEGEKVLFPLMFTDATASGGWGTMEPAIWQEQLDLWDKVGAFKGKPAPAIDDVMTTEILDATKDARNIG